MPKNKGGYKMQWLKELLANETDNEKIIKNIVDKIKQEYVKKADYDAIVTTKQGLEEQITQRDKDIKDLKEATKDNADLQKKYAELENKYKADTENLQKQYENSRKESAIDMAILQAKGRNPKAIKALLDMEKIKLKEDGTLEGLDLESVKKSDGYLFDSVETHREGINSGASSGFYGGSGHYNTSYSQNSGTIGTFSNVAKIFAQSARRAAGLSAEKPIEGGN